MDPKKLVIGLCTSVALLAAVCAHASPVNLNEKGLALAGYDPVSFFDGAPERGRSRYATQHDGVRYLFAGKTNREKFLADPDAYLPAYGGYCSYGVRVGKKFEIEPTAFEVIDGRLYLLLNMATRALWQQQTKQNISIADRNWPQIRDIPAGELNAE